MALNNRIDVYDLTKDKWREARVIDTCEELWDSELNDELTFEKMLLGRVKPSYKGSRKISRIKVHFKGLSRRYDEVIERAEFGTRIASV